MTGRAPRRYTSVEEDSDRWTRFPFRDGDVVVSTRSKSGTTWMQQICLSLVHGSPHLPAPLSELSPWVDWLIEPEESLFARLAEQPGRRVLKTHTPLDGVVLDPRASYVVVVRDPLDMAVSMYHQGDNLDRERFAELSGRPVWTPPPRPELPVWLVEWAREETDPVESMDSLQGVVRHVADAWARREAGNVHLVRYEDLSVDLEGQMRRLAQRLAIEVPAGRWPALVEGAGFAAMRAEADRRVPDLRGVLRDPEAFFRRGRPGAGRELLPPSELPAYGRRVRELAERYAAPGEAADVVALLVPDRVG